MSQESSARIPVDVRRFPWVRRLAADYAYNFRSLAPFYAGDPSAQASWAAAIARAQAREQPRDDMAKVIGAQQRRRGAPAAALEAGARLRDPKTVAILTGQQAGLFGGPLFTLFKALTAIRLADQVSHAFGVPAVAIFWVDAEDHDWNEVRAERAIGGRAHDEHALPVGMESGAVDALDPLERDDARLAESARKAYYTKLAYASAKARRR